MKTKILTAAALITLGLSAQAQANDGGIEFNDGTATFTCADLNVENLRWGLATYVRLANEDKDRKNLNDKLDQADEAVLDGKFCDAGLKVSDFGVKLDGLYIGRNGKSKAFDDYSGLAIECLVIGAEHEAERLRAMSSYDCGEITDPPRGKGPKSK